MGKIFEVTCPHCMQAFEVEAPTAQRGVRGQLAGIAIADMTDEQLKREIINANSVYYKSVKRGASEETINAASARLEAAKAERDARKAAAKVDEPAATEWVAPAETANEPVVFVTAETESIYA